MRTKVECYAGGTYPEKPRTFVWQEQRYTVQEILQRRREPGGVGFLVIAVPGSELFDLFYFEQDHNWRILPKGPIDSQD